jgi:hypothetical protein
MNLFMVKNPEQLDTVVAASALARVGKIWYYLHIYSLYTRPRAASLSL